MNTEMGVRFLRGQGHLVGKTDPHPAGEPGPTRHGRYLFVPAIGARADLEALRYSSDGYVGGQHMLYVANRF